MRLGRFLRTYRRFNDMGVRDLAEEIGVSASTISRVERGEAMTGETLAAVLRWLLEEESDG